MTNENVMPKILGFDNKSGFYQLEENGKVAEHEMERGSGEFALRFSAVSRHLRWLQGEILTVLEATIDDERKLKATKEIAKDKFNAKISWIYEMCGTPEEEQDALSE